MANMLIGRFGNLALYANDSVGVIIDTSVGLIMDSGDASKLYSSFSWEPSNIKLNAPETLLANRALENLVQDSIIASADRMFSIPKSVQAEAQKALDWHREHKRGGTSVGLNTARILAGGGQVGIRKIKHIAKYFPRHEVDKQAKGWRPGEDNFPSNGRIAWALWGGDAGQRWSKAITEREEKALVADSYINTQSQLTPFEEAHMLDDSYGPEFLARVDLEGNGIDRLYKIDIDGRVSVWDDESWDDLGTVDGDIWIYDKALDGPYVTTEKTHVIVDPNSALIIAARLAANPYRTVAISDIDEDEAELVALGLADEDWQMIDIAMTAAGTVATPSTPTSSNTPVNQDGNYTPQERSTLAKAQPRDSSGHFVKVGSTVVVGGDSNRGTGTLTKINADTGMVDVQLKDGRTISVDPKFTRPQENPASSAPQTKEAQLDVTGILGEPKSPVNQPKAVISGELPVITGDKVKAMLADWANNVTLLRGKSKSVTAAAPAEENLTPETTDVPAKYIAIVSPQAPDAVMDLVAIVPKTATTTIPATYKRQDKKWVYDEQIYNDLVSATPPPVIELDKASLNDVLTQMDETGKEKPETISAAALIESIDAIYVSFYEGTPLVAAGGLDRNRGNAEALRRYWVHGEGAAKIRWGQPGDWKRCVRHLSKYLGIRSKGYCQLRHKEAMGIYTATHAKRDRNNG